VSGPLANPGTERESAARAANLPRPQAAGERWVALGGGGALAVFLGLMIFCCFVQSLAGRVVWTVAVAALPLTIVLAGYHRWRSICPLAWFAKLPARLGRPGKRRASRGLQANYYYAAFAVFFTALWLRLIAINGDGKILAGFLVLISLSALAFGLLFTGKTWCNYVCPVSFIEKIYTEPRGLRQTPNSQCPKCTACKPACPDINEENGYWKEVLLAPKRFVYFAYPGLIFAFYLYYYLQSGTWDYYFSGRWTNEPNLIRTAFSPGHSGVTAGFFFLPSEPRAVAALVTLAAGALLSVALFSLAEKVVGRRLRRRAAGADEASVRHLMFTAAAFTAFVTFYAFAGAPTLRLISGVPHLFQILVVLTATLFLARRFNRRQSAFAEETLARQIIRRWQWADTKPPEDLHEAFLIHSIRSQTQAIGHQRLLEIYKESVREAVASGFLSRAEVQRLESLRGQLQITHGDHEKIMADLDEEERARIANPALQGTAEKRLQLDSYSRALETYLARVSDGSESADDAFIRHLGQQYAITPEEHAAVLDELFGKGQHLAPHVARAFAMMEGAAHTLQLLSAAPSTAGAFLADALSRRCTRSADGLMRGLGCSPEDEKNRPLRNRLLSSDEAERAAAVETLGGSFAPAIAARLLEARRQAAAESQSRSTLAECVRSHLSSTDPYVRAAALYLLHRLSAADAEILATASRDEHELVHETAAWLAARASGSGEGRLMTIEKMIALRSVPLFSSLAPEDLLGLARGGIEKDFGPGEALCVEGEPGHEVFVLLSGEVQILRQAGGEPKLVGIEKAGAFIGEMAVLDPAPRAATVLAGAEGIRALSLEGAAFRGALDINPSVVHGVIGALAARLRGKQPQARNSSSSASPPPG
jgi:Cyclic nucleotide-binding domain